MNVPSWRFSYPKPGRPIEQLQPMVTLELIVVFAMHEFGPTIHVIVRICTAGPMMVPNPSFTRAPIFASAAIDDSPPKGHLKASWSAKNSVTTSANARRGRSQGTRYGSLEAPCGSSIGLIRSEPWNRIMRSGSSRITVGETQDRSPSVAPESSLTPKTDSVLSCPRVSPNRVNPRLCKNFMISATVRCGAHCSLDDSCDCVGVILPACSLLCKLA